jgi:acetophenone carboxylase
MLARSGRAEPGIFAPLVLAQAAEIEALDVAEFLANPTKLTKGLTALHQALRTDAVVTTAPFGGRVDDDAGARELDAAVEATSRLAATLPGEPVLVAALTGPATRARQAGSEDLEAAGTSILDGLRRLLEAGANLVVLVEEEAPPAADVELWRSVVTPLVNVARFHQALPVVVFESPSAVAVEAVPVSAGVCGPPDLPAGGPPARVWGVALPVEPKEWTAPGPGVALVTTSGVVPAHVGFAEVLDGCGRLRSEAG